MAYIVTDDLAALAELARANATAQPPDTDLLRDGFRAIHDAVEVLGEVTDADPYYHPSDTLIDGAIEVAKDQA